MFDIETVQRIHPHPRRANSYQFRPQKPCRGWVVDYNNNQPRPKIAVRDQLHKDLERANYRAALARLINAAVYGTGIGELVIEDSKEYVPATQPLEGVPEASLVEYGVQERLAIICSTLFSLKTS